MNRIFNTRILSHPVNWLTVWSMALIMFYVAHLLISYMSGCHPGSTNQNATEGVAGPGTDVPENAFVAS